MTHPSPTPAGLYEELIRRATEEAAQRRPRPPRASASIVPWRRRGGAVEVFWVQRSPALRFMGGWHAFPGGALAEEDRGLALGGNPRGILETPSQAGMPEPVPTDLAANEVPGIVACALRELFEECGILPLSPDGGALSQEGLDAARRQLLDETASFPGLLAPWRARPDARRLVYAGRWITPPLAPVRFDNRFFLLEWTETEAVQPSIWPGELSLGEWIEPARALAAWERGEVLTSPPIAHILRVLAEDGPEGGLPRLVAPVEANLGPFRKVEFRPGVVLIPLRTPTLPPATHTNSFLLGLGEAVLVDPGSPLPGEIAALKRCLRDARQLHGLDVKEIWLTHHHPDHVGGLEEIRGEFRLPVCAHRATAERLAGLGIAIDRFLEDGQRIVLGGARPFPVQVRHTPGHARGHLCFYDETYGSLIAGDLVAGIGTIVIDPPEGDMAQYLDSLEKMIELAPRTLFPAHGPPKREALGSLIRLREHRLAREAKVLAAWQGGLREPLAMVPDVYGEEIPPEIHPVAARQVLAHLDRLRSQGRI